MAKEGKLSGISPDKIVRNPDNPRLIFREEDMAELLESIRAVGIKVPISLYQEGNKYVLIDGERRWKCAKRLNKDTIPAIIQPKPSPLENLLMMFNIHSVRVDWDLMPTAIKLRKVMELLRKDGQPSDQKAVAGITGLSPARVKRLLELLDLPVKYQKLLVR